jgi:hypothetical protein
MLFNGNLTKLLKGDTVSWDERAHSLCFHRGKDELTGGTKGDDNKIYCPIIQNRSQFVVLVELFGEVAGLGYREAKGTTRPTFEFF